MKKLVPWLKANWIGLTALVLAIIAAPVALYFAAGWRASVLKTVETNVSQDITSLNAIDVTYEVQPFLSGQEPISVKAVPNEASTRAVTRILEMVQSESAAVREAAQAFNARDKRPLIGGTSASENLFPEPADESSRLRLLSRMVTEWPRAHEELLRRSHMGMPLSADHMVTTLQQVQSQEVSRLDSGQPGRALTPDEQAEIARVLSERRVQLYRNEARRVTAYAEPAVFRGVTAWPATTVLPLETAWQWQMLFWIHEEIIRAIVVANADSVGGWLPVYEAPVKRIESIAVSAPTKSGTAAGGGGDRGAPGGPTGGEPQPPGDERAETPRDFSLTHTGRASWPVIPNPIYDIRYVDVRMIVSSERLPSVLAAFPKTNFMTVVGLSILDYDPKADMREGFDYGAEHLVRADIRIETIWLRGWMKQWMPPKIRTALGIAEEPKPGESADTQNQDTPPEE